MARSSPLAAVASSKKKKSQNAFVYVSVGGTSQVNCDIVICACSRAAATLASSPAFAPDLAHSNSAFPTSSGSAICCAACSAESAALQYATPNSLLRRYSTVACIPADTALSRGDKVVSCPRRVTIGAAASAFD